MNRPLYTLGWSYVALCGLLLAMRACAPPPLRLFQAPEPPISRRRFKVKGKWFAHQAILQRRRSRGSSATLPAPATVDGAGYSAACYALAGKIDQARKVIDGLPADQRSAAAGMSSRSDTRWPTRGTISRPGPIMRLVIDYQPDNYMALYHAGMSEYILGQTDFARTHLKQFMALYPSEDGWRGNARDVLNRLEGK